jgi:hypothetical protein
MVVTVTIGVTDVNEAPAFASDETGARSIAENAAADTPVGDPVTATDEDQNADGTPRDTVTHTLGGDDVSSFEIDSATGQLKVGADTTLDYEATKNTYTVTVTASDGVEATDDATITVTITVTARIYGNGHRFRWRDRHPNHSYH